MKKRWWILAGVLGVYLLFSNSISDFLPKFQDITQVKLVRALAVDKGEEDGMLKLTSTGTVTPTGDGGESRPPLILKTEAQTFLSGVTDLQRQSQGYVEFGHLTQCVVGEEQATESVQGILDFIERDYSMRLDTKLFLVVGATGEELVDGASSKYTDVTQRLEAIQEDEVLGGYWWSYNLREIIAHLEDNGSALIPALKLEDNPDYNKDQPDETPKSNVKLSGLAFLKEYKLGGLLTEDESRGTALLIDQDQLDVLEFTMENGAVVGIQLVYARSKIEPVFDETGKLTELQITVSMKGDLNEIRGWADPLDQATLDKMEQNCLQELESLCRAALDRSWEEGVDFLHLRRRLITQCPLEALSIQQHWEEWFPDITCTVKAEGHIERTYDVDRPMEENKGG